MPKIAELRSLPEPRHGYVSRQPDRTSQLALPEDASADARAMEEYEASVGNLAAITLDSDNVFSDGAELQTPSITGSADSAFTTQLRVTV
ncbi:MAG: hypothetical protein EOO73_04960 [Myxococcales bacterium]|nr:MAG: hypothetical protein EOO73_04960 [Myxococcales bacterium]